MKIALISTGLVICSMFLFSFLSPENKESNNRSKKPTYSIQTKSNPLFKQFNNFIKITCTNCEKGKALSFTANGGKVKKINNKGEIYLYPEEEVVELNIEIEGKLIGKESFISLPIPTPTIEIKFNGKPLSIRNIKGGVIPPDTISVAIVPSPFLSSIYPDESKYKIDLWSVQLAKGRRPVSGAKKFTSSKGSVSDLKSKITPEGYRMIIEVARVVRESSTGEIIPVQAFKTNPYIRNIIF